MKLIALALISIAVTHVHGAETISKHYDLSKVATLIAVVERSDYADENKDKVIQFFEPLKTKFAEPEEITTLCKAIGESEATKAGMGPFVGHLCHVVLLDKDQNILGMVSILNFHSYCDISAAHRDDKGRIVADYGKKAFGFTSTQLARAFYDRLKKDDPAYMKELSDFYAESGKTVEDLLFGKQETKPKSEK